MLSQFSIRIYKLYFTYCTLFCLPYRWDKGRIRVKTSLWSQFVWKIMGLLHVLYLIWVCIRFGVSLSEKAPMQNLIFHSLSLAIRIQNLGCLLNTPKHWKGIGRAINQMLQTNEKLTDLLSPDEKKRLDKMDVYGVIIFFFVTSSYVYPLLATSFFLAVPDIQGYIYTAVPPEIRDKYKILLIPVFAVLEYASGFYIASTAVLYIVHASSCFLHTAYWLKLARTCMDNGRMTVWRAIDIFKMQQIFTQIVNYNLSGVYLPVVKEAMGLLSVVNCFTLIKFFAKLDWKTLPVLGFVSGGAFLALCTVYMMAGLVWKQSVALFTDFPIRTKLERKMKKSVQPFGIRIGAFYIMKHHTILHTMAILVQFLCNLLITFK